MKLALEGLAWSAGIALLTLYCGVRIWSAEASQQAVLTFREVRPDTSTWAPERLAAYRRSLGETLLPEVVLRIPSLRLEVPVFAGTNEQALNRGAGHIEGTGAFDVGNAGIAAHRDGFFRALRQVRVGDLILLEGRLGTTAYRVARIRIVEPDAVDVLADTGAPALTLVTCYPFYYVGPAPQRFIVHAVRSSTSGPQLWVNR